MIGQYLIDLVDDAGYLPPDLGQAAERLGASIIREYVEPGKSATTTNRPALQRLLAELFRQGQASGEMRAGHDPLQLGEVLTADGAEDRNALERALYLESDRMGYLLGAVTQDKLDKQRGVVQNEKRQGDNEPFGMVEYAQLEGLFPEGHPYRHSTIGSMADLDAATMVLAGRGAPVDDHVGEVEGLARFATVRDPDGNPVYLHDIWPSPQEIQETIDSAIARTGVWPCGCACSGFWWLLAAGERDRISR